MAHAGSVSIGSLNELCCHSHGLLILTPLNMFLPQLEAHHVFRGAAGECMRPAALKFIERMCGCQLPVQGLPVIGEADMSHHRTAVLTIILQRTGRR